MSLTGSHTDVLFMDQEPIFTDVIKKWKMTSLINSFCQADVFWKVSRLQHVSNLRN